MGNLLNLHCERVLAERERIEFSTQKEEPFVICAYRNPTKNFCTLVRSSDGNSTVLSFHSRILFWLLAILFFLFTRICWAQLAAIFFLSLCSLPICMCQWVEITDSLFCFFSFFSYHVLSPVMVLFTFRDALLATSCLEWQTKESMVYRKVQFCIISWWQQTAPDWFISFLPCCFSFVS